jgi:4-amino-4-deoxy-L-arabinose transferase-like glycosyltransferase
MVFWHSLSWHDRWLLLAFVALKIALVVALPLTGDEAYFIGWGQNLASGYYDHPPAVGWVLFALSSVADNLYWYRSFALFTSGLVAYVLYKFLRLELFATPSISITGPQAFYVALVFFVSPVSLMFVVTANDTVLVFFGIVGGYFFARSVQAANLSSYSSSQLSSQFLFQSLLHRLWPVLAGLFLGLAFLSKYFAAFVLLGFLLWSLANFKTVPWWRVAFIALVVLGFVAQNFYFNATQCWNNILFNFFSRTAESAFSLLNVGAYLAMLVAMMSPLGVYYLIQYLRQARAKNGVSPGLVSVNNVNSVNHTPLNARYSVVQWALYASVPLLLVLLVVSFNNPIGLHWPLLAVVWLFLLYALLPIQKLVMLYRFSAYSALVLGSLLLVGLGFVEQLVPESQRKHVALYTQPQTVCAQLPKTAFFTLDYSSQSALAYHCQNDAVHVLPVRLNTAEKTINGWILKPLTSKTLPF